MGDLLSRLPELQAALDALATRYRVPGAALSILDGEHTVDLATGLANCATGVEVTPETLFQIGSITKVYTATVMMRLVDQGQLDLDVPIRQYLPTFRLKDEEVAATITSRHLLTHSSGIVSDYHADFGPGPDCLERYVATLDRHELVHPPGRMFSYSNAAFNLAGRVIEAVTSKTYDDALSAELLDPLRLDATTLSPAQMLRFRYAVGHGVDAQGTPTVPPVVLMYRSTGPAGGLTSATASDVLRFARLHMENGRAPDGSVVVSETGIQAMRTPSFPLPGLDDFSIGLGWLVAEFGGEQALFHVGGTIHQFAFLFVLPERRFGVCLLTNADAGWPLWAELGPWLFETLAGVELPRPPKPPASAPTGIDLTRYAATYERLTQRFDVAPRDDHLTVRMTTVGMLGEESTAELEAWPIDDRHFYAGVGDTGTVITFLEPDRDGRPGYLHHGSSVAVRRKPLS